MLKAAQPITREALHELYVVQGLNVIRVARALRRRNDAVVAALREYGFTTHVTKDWMEEQYVQQGKSVDDIAASLGCTEENVRYYLRSYDIPIRYKSRGSQRVPLLNDPVWLYTRYVEQRRASAAIAEELGCAQGSVVRALVRFGITRDHSIQPLWREKGQQRYFTQKTRREIFTRDGFLCQMCRSSAMLETHHIIRVTKGGTNAASNGITLCADCHGSIQGCDGDLIERFQAMVQGHSA